MTSQRGPPMIRAVLDRLYMAVCLCSQIGRSTESPIDLVVTDTVPGGSQGPGGGLSIQSTISRFACRIICHRDPPYTARIYAAGFDSSKNIFLGVGRPRRWIEVGQSALSPATILANFPFGDLRCCCVVCRRRRPSGGCQAVRWTDSPPTACW